MKQLHLLLVLTLHGLFPAGALAIETTKDTAGQTAVEQEVADVERAFAKSMADRNFEAFSAFIGEDAVFVSGPQILRGKEQITTAWKALFESEAAPFSWQPETVIALPSGDLALSTGPVTGADGKVSVYYTSTWRKNAAGEWKIIFDKGQEVCAPDKG